MKNLYAIVLAGDVLDVVAETAEGIKKHIAERFAMPEAFKAVPVNELTQADLEKSRELTNAAMTKAGVLPTDQQAPSKSWPTPRTHTVYKGYKGNELVYVGTTIQKPEARFRWHRAHGKDLRFVIVAQYDNAQAMLAREFALIQKHKPRLNKITHRPQNLNRALSADQVQERVGLKGWCQSCLKRRVNEGYTSCMYCKA